MCIKIKLTPYAKIFYTDWLLTPDSSRYNLSIDQTLYGNLDIPRLKRALKRYISEHLILNSHIQSVDGEPYWVTNHYINELEYSNCSIINTSELLNYVNRSFDLHNEPLYRFRLLRLADDIYRFTVVMHHLVMDGSSSLDPGVFEAISSYYNDENYTIKPNLSEQANLITNLTNTLSIRLEQNEIQYKEFWDKQLSDVESIDLKFLKWNKNNNNKNTITTDILNSIEVVKFNYGDIESAKLAQIRHVYSITPYAYSQCILALLLHRYTDQEKLAISYPIAIKDGIDFIYGAQINTNLIPYQFNDNTTIVDLFEQSLNFSKLTLRDDIKCGYHPISDIIQGSDKRLLDICFNQTFFRDNPFGFAGINTVEIADLLNLNRVTSDMLLFEQNPRNNGLHYRVVYDKNTFDKDLVGNFVTTYQKLFLEVLEDLLAKKSHKRLSAYSLLNAQQYHQIVYEFNRTEKDYPQNKTIHSLFEEQVIKTPDNVAVVYEDTKLTYQELNQKSNQLANYLLSLHKIRADDLITLCLDRNEHILVAILGALKSGGAYVPIDPKFPDDRISYILSDTKTNIILTNSSCQARLQQIIQQGSEKSTKNISTSKPIVIALDDVEILGSLLQQKNNNPITATTSNNLVYVLYTSGTTGQPKGVMLEHVGCVNRILAMINVSQMTGKEKVLFKTNYIFDVSFSDIFTALLTGASLIVTKNVFDVDEIASNFSNYSIDICHFTPSQFEAINSIKEPRLFKKTKILNFSGEALYPKLLGGIDKNILCANYYGPTETGEVTFENTKLTEFNKNISTIGKPLHNIKLFILDKYMKPLPIGAIGELYIGGICLARGYLNNTQLTNSKFIVNSLQTAEKKSLKINNRLYKTGDLVRWLPNGNIEYIGRNDSQIKIRGHRVELIEIENQLLKFGSVKQAVIIAKEKIGHKLLVAYYVANEKLDDLKLNDYLRSRLPDHMVPNVFVYMQFFPVNDNGKLDHKSLPEPELIDELDKVVPRSELEGDICKIYAKVLGLSIEQVGVRDDFFRLGGDSISSIQIVSKIRRCLGVSVKVQDIFKYRNIEQLIKNVLIRQNICDKDVGGREQKQVEIGSIYLANSIQQGFLYHDIRYGKASSAYLMHFVCSYKTKIDKFKFKQAWQLVQNKYPSLRLRFTWDTELIQIVEKTQEVNFRYVDLSTVNTADHEKEIISILAKDRKEGYELRQGNLFRVYLIKLSEEKYTCVLSAHHVVLDGWSSSLLLNNVHEIYSQLLNNEKTQIEEDVTYLQAQKYLQEHNDEHLDYWRSYLKQTIEDRGDLKALLKPSAKDVEIKNHLLVKEEQEEKIEIAGEKLVILKELCRYNAITINSIIQYAWHKILHLYGSTNTTVVGTVISGRNIPIDHIENTVGVFINTLPSVVIHNSTLSLIEQIKKTQSLINGLNERGNVNLANLQAGSERLFDSILVYENYPVLKFTSELKCENIQDLGKVEYPLVVFVYETKQKIVIRIQYAGELFDQATIVGLLQKLLFFIEQIMKNPNKNALNYLDQKEYQHRVIDYNKATRDYPICTVPQLFESQVLKVPDNLALVFENTKLTYRELNIKANQLAHFLLSNYVIRPDDLIVLYLDRSEYMIIAILAVLKAGGAYVPIEPYYPDERTKYILDDAETKVILTSRVHKKRLRQIIGMKIEGIDIVAIDDKRMQAKLAKQEHANPTPTTIDTNLVYIIYTSGTTGNPKGVMVEHRGVINTVLSLEQVYDFKDGNKITAFTSYMFDVSASEFFVALFSGAELHLLSEEKKKDVELIAEYIKNAGINYIYLPPAMLSILPKLKYETLKAIIYAGEPCDSVTGKYWSNAYKLYNYYGPTEITIYATGKQVIDGDTHLIGAPILNVQCYVLDNQLTPLPTGVAGELHIGGAGLARGYLHHPELTAKKFVPNPFQTAEEKAQNKNPRIYKTGDMVRMLPDGNLEYIGRNDFQVKIRGYRVELGEIENKLLSYPEVKQAAALIKESIRDSFLKAGDKYIVAYYVANQKLNEVKIYNYLSTQLPEYMLPSILIYLNKLPLTINGKLDRASLPETRFEVDDRYLEPRNEKEQVICKAFGNVLGIEKVGINDDFFRLGGNSLTAITLASILHNNFDIKIAHIFNLRTPLKLAEHLQVGKNLIKQKLELVKQSYKATRNKSYKSYISCPENKTDIYLENINGLQTACFMKKPIANVLLSGATGYLGCNILHQLLKMTDYKLYLPIRAKSTKEALERISKKYQFYFDKTLDDVLNSRVFVLKADLEKSKLGLLPQEYRSLVAKIDSIIHVAALVKHYGDYEKFYSANVQGTINLLELTKATKLKDFHYVSTTGVLYETRASKGKQYFTEEDLPEIPEVLDHIYVQTKLQGEHQTIKYRDYGLNTNIYRIGNLAYISENYRVQENIQDNAFYNWLKCLFSVKYSTQDINTVEISQTDLTAQAIVKLFDKQRLNNQIYHVFNPNLFDLTNIFKNKNIEMLPMENFINKILYYIQNGIHYQLVVNFLLRQRWLDWWEKRDSAFFNIRQNKTQHILRQLDFEWPLLTEKTITNYINFIEKSIIKDKEVSNDK